MAPLTSAAGFIIRDDPAAVGEYLAAYIARRITEFDPKPARKFVLGLPAGSSPLPTYKALIAMVQRGALSFQHVVTFNMDEYVGLPREHPESYHTFMCAGAHSPPAASVAPP